MDALEEALAAFEATLKDFDQLACKNAPYERCPEHEPFFIQDPTHNGGTENFDRPINCTCNMVKRVERLHHIQSYFMRLLREFKDGVAKGFQ